MRHLLILPALLLLLSASAFAQASISGLSVSSPVYEGSDFVVGLTLDEATSLWLRFYDSVTGEELVGVFTPAPPAGQSAGPGLSEWTFNAGQGTASKNYKVVASIGTPAEGQACEVCAKSVHFAVHDATQVSFVPELPFALVLLVGAAVLAVARRFSG